ncbi:hypothetical protein J0H58_16245 [bacterium]|nr:hypothetical protein [bacterium]
MAGLVAQSGATPDPVEAKLKRLDVRVKRDPTRPGNPVVEVRVFKLDTTDADLAALADLTECRKLDLHASKVRGTGLAALSALPLEELRLSFSGLDNEGLKEVAKFVSLKRFDAMNASKVTGDGAAALATLKNLESLTLGQNFKHRDAAVAAALAGMAKLRSLDVTNSSAGDAAMKALAGCPDLRVLKLYGSEVGDAGMEAVGGLKNLEDLYLSSRVTDTGIAKLSELTELRHMSLYYGSRVTLPALQKLPHLGKLETLELKGAANITTGEARKAFPGVKVKP